MRKLSLGDLVRPKSGGPIMMVEADRGDDRYTFTWVAENGNAQSIVLPSNLVISVDSEAELNEVKGAAEKLPHDLRILDSQKAKVHAAMLAKNFNPASFEWSVVRSDYIPDGKISKVKGPEGTPYFFKFDRDENGKFVGIYSPGLEQLISIQTGDEYHLFLYVGQWLASLSMELRNPDPWTMLGHGVLEQAGATETDNTPSRTKRSYAFARASSKSKAFFLRIRI